MNPALHLRQLGQGLWLDNITRGLLTSGTLKKYIDDDEISGLSLAWYRWLGVDGGVAAAGA